MSLCSNKMRSYCVLIFQVITVICLAVVGFVLIRASKDLYLSDRAVFVALNALGVAVGCVLLLSVDRWRRLDAARRTNTNQREDR